MFKMVLILFNAACAISKFLEGTCGCITKTLLLWALQHSINWGNVGGYSQWFWLCVSAFAITSSSKRVSALRHSCLVNARNSSLLYRLLQTWPYIAAKRKNNRSMRLLCFSALAEIDDIGFWGIFNSGFAAIPEWVDRSFRVMTSLMVRM